MESFKQILESRGLAENSIKTYVRNLRILNKEFGVDLGIIIPSEEEEEEDKNKMEDTDVKEASLLIADYMLENDSFAGMSTATKKARVAALLVGIDPFKSDADAWDDESVIGKIVVKLREIAVTEQKKYHETASKKNKKEEKNWVSWKELRTKASETRSIWNAYLDKKGLLPPTIAGYGAKWKEIQNSWTPEEKKKMKKDRKFAESQQERLLLEYFKPYADIANKPFFTALFNAAIATIYTELPPRRLDWVNLKFMTQEEYKKMCESEEEEEEAECWRDIIYVAPSEFHLFSSKSFIHFGRNAGKSPQQEDLKVGDLTSTLRIMIGTIVGITKITYWEVGATMMNILLQNPVNGEPLEENALGKKIKKIFSGKYKGVKKSITSSLMRKIFITDEFKGEFENRHRIAKLMNHSVKIQQNIYNKHIEQLEFNKETGSLHDIHLEIDADAMLGLESNQIQPATLTEQEKKNQKK